MMRFDVYEYAGDSLGAAASEIGKLLELSFELHDSSYLGGDYYLWHGKGREKITIQSNLQEDGELSEPDHPNVSIVVYASYLSPDFFGAIESIDSLKRLRTKEI